MPVSPVTGSNIFNRSPWLVQVRAKPLLNKPFPFYRHREANAYVEALKAQGLRATLTQLETSFQLRLRRKGLGDQCITFDTYEAAEQARLKIEAELSVSIVRDYASAAQVTLRELMVRYRDEVVPGHKGADVEKNRISRILRDEAFVDKKLAALCTEDLQDFIRDRLTEVAPSTVDRDLDILSQVIRYSADVWKIAAVESPFVGLRRPKYFNERDRRLSASEEDRLLNAAQADENPYIEPAVILALETAARRGELLAIEKRDVHLDECYVLLRETKNGQPRKIPLTTRAKQVLGHLVAECETDNERLLKLTPNALKIGFFRRVIPASGIEDLHFHDLRHEAISRLAESGLFQLIELQAISGHRDTRMLLRYAHLCAGNLAKKMDSVAAERSTKDYLHRGRRRRVEKVVPIPALANVNARPPAPSPPALPQNVVPFRGRMAGS